ncbi:MAG: winged helix DNA-binding domain-containing protein [Microbacterium sp.]
MTKRQPERVQPLGAGELSYLTMHRQHLLAPAPLSPIELTQHLVGLQAQNPWSWYAGFFRRIDGVHPEAVSSHLEDRSLVRMSAMRATIHLMTPEDAATLRSHTQIVHQRTMKSSFGRDLKDVSVDDVTVRAQALLEERPYTLKELGVALGRKWPETRPSSLAMVARFMLPLVQVPPRGQWGQSGPVAYTTLDTWVGQRIEPRHSIEEVILRYLVAFGPATIMDFQIWSGLTKCKPHFENLEEGIVQLQSDRGQTLYDLNAIERPTPQTGEALPVRFLYDYDNLLLAYKDRSRFITPAYSEMQRMLDGTTLQAILVNGKTVGMWAHKKGRQSSLLEARLCEHLSRNDLDAVENEAHELVKWLEPDINSDVRIHCAQP